jgi:hypothetical protein
LFVNKWLNKAKVIRKPPTNLGLLTRAVPHSSLKEGLPFFKPQYAAT